MLECQLTSNSLQSNIIYQATVKTANNEEKVYIEVTEGHWKQKLCTHHLPIINRQTAQPFLKIYMGT